MENILPKNEVFLQCMAVVATMNCPCMEQTCMEILQNFSFRVPQKNGIRKSWGNNNNFSVNNRWDRNVCVPSV